MIPHNERLDALFSSILALGSVEECYAFFDDLCTVKELTDMSQRLLAAIMLADGHSYQEIASAVGISSATIGRVSRCLAYGSGGYRAAIERIKSQNANNGQSETET